MTSIIDQKLSDTDITPVYYIKMTTKRCRRGRSVRSDKNFDGVPGNCLMSTPMQLQCNSCFTYYLVLDWKYLCRVRKKQV